MAVNVARVTHAGEARWAVVGEDRLVLLPHSAESTRDLVRRWTSGDLSNHRGEAVSWNQVRLLSPVTPDRQFICQGANYRSHMVESGIDPNEKSFNMLFTKAPSSMCPADADVIRPKHVQLLDYEIELGLVLKKDIDGPLADGERLEDLIYAITIVNDYSARDVQLPQSQFYKGKSYRTFAPVGPWLSVVQPGDLQRLEDLRLTLTVNDNVRQDAKAGELVHKPMETLRELAELQNLQAGDLLATGTPAGCALRAPSKTLQRIGAMLPEPVKWRLFVKGQLKRPYLAPGDVVRARIRSADGLIDLGEQKNRIVQG